MNLYHFVKESNRIEGITREPHPIEIAAHEEFLSLEKMTILDLIKFVNVVADARLRDRPGMNVSVGNHQPPDGGSAVVTRLERLLRDLDLDSPHALHCQYEDLHPFMDGNGRSGRVLWLWMMGGIENAPLGFLHHFYYQTLQASR